MSKSIHNVPDDIRRAITVINSELSVVRAYKEAHPESKCGFYKKTPGSILNAYREGDLSFEESLEELQNLGQPLVLNRMMTAELNALVDTGHYGQNIYEAIERIVAAELHRIFIVKSIAPKEGDGLGG